MRGSVRVKFTKPVRDTSLTWVISSFSLFYVIYKHIDSFVSIYGLGFSLYPQAFSNASKFVSIYTPKLRCLNFSHVVNDI